MHPSRIKSDIRGIAAVEFALLAPVFFLMIFGLIALGHVYWIASSLEFAIYGGGRFAMLNPGAPDYQVISEAKAHLYGIDTGSVAFTTSTSVASGITYMTLQVQFPFSFLPNVLPPITLERHVQVPQM
jgi:Flp pilus assembly protein TadG